MDEAARALEWLKGVGSRWNVWDDRRVGPVGRMLALDRRRAEDVGAGRAPPGFRIWSSDPALVVSRRESQRARFEEARTELRRLGWPVAVRDSGGGTVPVTPGTLQLSLFFPHGHLEGLSVERVYGALVAPVRIALHGLDVPTRFGRVPDAFCDGPYDLVTAGRKLAGTSQRWRGGIPPAVGPEAHVLAHLSLLVSLDLERATEAVNRFVARVDGGRPPAVPQASIEVRERMEGAVGPRGDRPTASPLVERVRAAIVETLVGRLGARVRRSGGRRASPTSSSRSLPSGSRAGETRRSPDGVGVVPRVWDTPWGFGDRAPRLRGSRLARFPRGRGSTTPPGPKPSAVRVRLFGPGPAPP